MTIEAETVFPTESDTEYSRPVTPIPYQLVHRPPGEPPANGRVRVSGGWYYATGGGNPRTGRESAA
jgi:hypothetical protein